MRLTSDNENDIEQTEPLKLPSRTSDALPAILPLESNPQSALLSEAISDTINYADSCMNELIERMQDVGQSEEVMSNEKMVSVALGARSVAEVMREKINAMKLLKD